jgi:hypothetical protein
MRSAFARWAGDQPSYTQGKVLHRCPGPWKVRNLQIAQFAGATLALERIAGFFHRHPFRETP